MMHDFLVGALYVGIVITPCVIAWFRRVDRNDDTESDVLNDGFI
jgi:hypothetical protein